MTTASYEQKIEQQIAQYREVANLHDLPDIFHYWSNKYLRPLVNTVIKVDSITGFYAQYFFEAAKNTGCKRFLSLGAGDCAVEIEVAQHLQKMGLSDFEITCLELSPYQVERACLEIKARGLDTHVVVDKVDLNTWNPAEGIYSGIMAHHSLHHMVELEHIFSATHRSLHALGTFVTNDMIGRNGHMRWPEALHYIERIWAFMPDYLKFNRTMNRFDEQFINWDCSNEGFEGIRAQDILPLLCEHFEFSHFLAYGGFIDVFIDRSYGHNFDPNNPKDIALIDFIHELNELTIDHGLIKPTTMFAVMNKNSSAGLLSHKHWTPKFSIRKP